MFKKVSLLYQIVIFFLAFSVSEVIVNKGFQDFPIMSVIICTAVCVPLYYLAEYAFAKLVKRVP